MKKALPIILVILCIVLIVLGFTFISSNKTVMGVFFALGVAAGAFAAALFKNGQTKNQTVININNPKEEFESKLISFKLEDVDKENVEKYKAAGADVTVSLEREGHNRSQLQLEVQEKDKEKYVLGTVPEDAVDDINAVSDSWMYRGARVDGIETVYDEEKNPVYSVNVSAVYTKAKN